MDSKYFNVKLEFDHEKVDQIIQKAITSGTKGYICSVEGNIIAVANVNHDFRSIVNKSLVNICDGSSIALFASVIHKKKLRTYVGADLFVRYIKMSKYKSYFLGNTQEVLSGLKANLLRYDKSIGDMIFQTLPFKDVNEFDYKSIANEINQNSPDIIWVSLGAAKQEIFMSKLLPYINKGLMFGFGAILNFYSNKTEEKRAPKLLINIKMEWIYRLWANPKKQWPKIKLIFKTYPRIIAQEIKSVKMHR